MSGLISLFQRVSVPHNPLGIQEFNYEGGSKIRLTVVPFLHPRIQDVFWQNSSVLE